MEACINYGDFANAKVVGAGGFGTVYLLPNGYILKAIRNAYGCALSKIEFLKQKQVYDSFNYLRTVQTDDPLIKLVQEYVIVSQPFDYCDTDFKIKTDNYACRVVMSKLNGVPISILKDLDPKSLEKFDPNYLSELGPNFEQMMHLSLNTDNSGIYGQDWNIKTISKANPSRGYFIGNVRILDQLRQKYGLKLSDQQIKQIIGFIYGWIYFSTKLIPIDIEITLGIYNGQFKINVLDFGMTFDLINIDQNPRDPQNFSQYGDLFNIIDSSKSEETKEKEIFEESLYYISLDLYADIQDNGDDDNKLGFYKGLNPPFNQKGGSYYKQKYLKYLRKYLELRKKIK